MRDCRLLYIILRTTDVLTLWCSAFDYLHAATILNEGTLVTDLLIPVTGSVGYVVASFYVACTAGAPSSGASQMYPFQEHHWRPGIVAVYCGTIVCVCCGSSTAAGGRLLVVCLM